MRKKETTNQAVSAVPVGARGATAAAAELDRLARAVEAGNFSARVNPDAVPAESRSLMVSVNRIVDSLAAPWPAITGSLEKLGAGVIPPKIADAFAGEPGAARNAVNACIEQWSEVAAEVSRMSDEHTRGDIDVFLPTDRWKGVYSGLARSMNDLVAGHIAVKKKAMACVDEFFERELRRSPGAIPGEKSIHQRNHRAVARECQAIH